MASRKKRLRGAPPLQVSHSRARPNAASEPPAGPNQNQAWNETSGKPGVFHIWSVSAVLLALVLAVGFYVRIETLQVWRTKPQQTFFQGQPMLFESDGYHYLRLGRDLIAGTYGKTDDKRGVPDHLVVRPLLPPLLSVLSAAVAKITGAAYTWIGALLAPMIGILVAFPVYFAGRRFGGPIAGLVAALATLLAPFYTYRTNFAFFRPDGLEVLLSVSACYFALRFGTIQSRKRYLDFAGWGVSYLLLLWAWGETIANGTLLCLPPFCVALALFYRPHRREAAVFFGLLASIITIAALLAGRQLLSGFQVLAGYTRFLFSGSGEDFFPTIGFDVSEMKRLPFTEFAHFASGNVLLLVASFVGLVLLIRKYPKELSIFVSPLIIGLSSYFRGVRFIIFLTPMMALGLGYLVHVVASQFTDKGRKAVGAIATVLIGVLLYHAAFPRTLLHPSVHPAVAAGMKLAGEKTPADAILWASWDQGYPLLYWADRATLADGAIMSPGLSVYLWLPLATSNFRLSANFMKFYATHGMDGMERIYRAVGGDRKKGFALIKEVLGAGPEKGRTILASTALSPEGDLRTTDEWLNYLYPSTSRPLYLFLDYSLTRSAYTWYWAGTWQGRPEEGRHPAYESFQGIRQENDELLSEEGLRVNLTSGEGTARGKAFRVTELLIIDNDKIVRRSYGTPGSHLEILQPMQFGAVMDEQIAASVFNILFLRHEAPPRYFTPVALQSPFFQLWEVHGDASQR